MGKLKYVTEDERRAARRKQALDYVKRNPKTAENARLKYVYGISLDDKHQMYDAQLGLCAICGEPQTFSICIDHCHETGIVRGLLCRDCNTGLGRFDTVQKLQLALNYLESFEAML